MFSPPFANNCNGLCKRTPYILLTFNSFKEFLSQNDVGLFFTSDQMDDGFPTTCFQENGAPRSPTDVFTEYMNTTYAEPAYQAAKKDALERKLKELDNG